MAGETTGMSRLTDADLDFVVETVASDAKDKAGLKALVQEDESFRKALIGDQRLFDEVVSDEEAFLRLSPALYFEVLFRQALKEMEKASHTVERAGSQTIAVFDTERVVSLLSQEPVLYYLADMLSSFTKITSYTIPVRVKPRVWRRIRFNDMDIDSLMRFGQGIDEESRFGVYKRIADVCLFVLGVFPERAQLDYRYPFSGALRPQTSWRARRGAQEYEEEGRRFYRLAGEHPSAKMQELSDVFATLVENFAAAWKPLNFISRHYFRHRRSGLFSEGPQQ